MLLAGVDPYRFAALDSALAGLRDPLLFPEGEPPLINRPGVPTIYPPIAQLWLALVAFFTPRAAGTWGLQIAAAGAVVLTTWLLARFLGNRQGGSCSTEPARRRAWDRCARRPQTVGQRQPPTLETTLQLELLRAVQA
jgi:hypothetical protein